MASSEDFDIMGNIKLIENYKAFLLSSVADLYSTMAKGNRGNIDDITDELSEIIILSYLLGKRLGLDYSSIDDRLLKKLKTGVHDEGGMDTEYQDYSRLISYIKGGRKTE